MNRTSRIFVLVVTTIAVLSIVAITTTTSKAQLAFAQESTDGASTLAPGTSQKAPGTAKDTAPKASGEQASTAQGWMPMEAPGQKGLTAGIIGPDIKK